MNYTFPPDVGERVKRQLASGPYESEDDVLRAAMAALERERDDFAAIQAGVEDVEAGRYRPLAEIDAELRQKYNFPRNV